MWIINPLKTVIVNSDQLTMIFISVDGKAIRASIPSDPNGRNYITLGEYNDKRASLRVMNKIIINMLGQKPVYNMPTQEELND